MSEAYKYQRGLMGNRNKKDTYNQDMNKTAEISWSQNEEEGLGESNTYRTYWKQMVPKEVADYLSNQLVWMDGETGWQKDKQY